jgi:DNA-binding transcriptional LysR family regulator
MESMASIQCFVRSAEAGSFSEAARRLQLTPAAVGKNVSRLEAHLGVRLFHRSTRSLALTESGARFLREVSGGLAAVQGALANLARADGQPAGALKVTMGTGFGLQYVVPMLDDFLARYPAIVPDWHFENRPVDLIAEGYDAAIGGGFDLAPGVVARELGPAHGVLLAAPAYLARHARLIEPEQLAEHEGIYIRSPQTGRVRAVALSDAANRRAPVTLKTRMTMSDPIVACEAAVMGLGITLVSVQHALPYLARGTLARVLPQWRVERGAVSIYFASQNILPGKTRAFVDFIVDQFRSQGLARRFSEAGAIAHSGAI